jgi:hypothetical protein
MLVLLAALRAGRRTRNPPVLAAVVAIGMAFTSCSHDCLALPCALPVAIVINVTGATSGASVDGASVEISGAATVTVPCQGTCRVPGTAGTYNLDVTAPGFAPVRRTLTVHGTNPPCGCPTVVTENVAIALVEARPSS